MVKFCFSATVQLGWPNSHFLFPLWLLVSIPPTSAPRHILFCSLSAHVGSGVTSFLSRGRQAVLNMDSPWKIGACALSTQLRDVLHLGSLCCHGLCKRFSAYVYLDVFKARAQLCLKYLTLYEDVWGFLKLFLWFIKEMKSDYTNTNRTFKRPNGNPFVCLFVLGIYMQLSAFAFLANQYQYVILSIGSTKNEGKDKKAKVLETHSLVVWSSWETLLTSVSGII